MKEMQQSDEDLVRMQMQQIEEMVNDSQQMWCDAEFPADDSSLYINPVQPPPWASPNVEWKRPHEIYTGDGEPVMLKDGASPGDVKQGELGDCWLLGAFLTLAT